MIKWYSVKEIGQYGLTINEFIGTKKVDELYVFIPDLLNKTLAKTPILEKA